MKGGRRWCLRWEKNEVSLTTALTNCFENFFRPHHSKGEPRWSSADSLNTGDNTDTKERPMPLKFVVNSTRELRAAKIENSRYLQKVCLKYSANYWSCMLLLKLPRLNNQPKGIKGIQPSTHTWPRGVEFPTSQKGKSHDSRGIW